MIGEKRKLFAALPHAVAALLFFLSVPALAATLQGSAGVFYDRSASNSSSADLNTFSSSSSGSIFLNLNYGSYVWDRRFLEYVAGFSTTFSSNKQEEQSGGFRSRGYNFSGNFFRGRPLRFTAFASRHTSWSFGDLLLFNSSSNPLVPVSGEFKGTSTNYGINGNWDTDFFEFFSFGYNRTVLDQTSDVAQARQKNEKVSFQAEKNTTRSRNRFDLARDEQEFLPFDSNSDVWSATLTDSFQLLAKGSLNLQNGYSSTSNQFSGGNESPALPGSAPGTSLPETKSSSSSFYSNANWNHSPSSRYRYTLGGGYSLGRSRTFQTAQWNASGNIYWNILKWFSLFGGAGTSEIDFSSRTVDENSRLQSATGGAALFGYYKRLSASLSGSVSGGRIQQQDDGQSGSSFQNVLNGSVNAPLFSRHSMSGEFLRERSRNDLNSVLNFDRTRFAVRMNAQNVKSFSYGASYANDLFVPSGQDFDFLKSRFSSVSAFLSRPIRRRGAVSFNFGAYKQTILDEKTTGKTYSFAADLALTSHLSSSAEVELEDFNSILSEDGIRKAEERLLKRINVNFRYAFGLSRIDLRFFLNQSRFDFQPGNRPSDSTGKSVTISFTRQFSLI